jgi:hypothetical protein
MIEVIREPDDMGLMERCCFCRRQTKHWTTLSDRRDGDQVACCCDCARRAERNDVPTKRGV